jgi:hypothetical protein
MNYTEEYALQIGWKVLKDIEFWDDDIEAPSTKYVKKSISLAFPENIWLVSFPYGAEDYGTDSNKRSRASMHVTVFDDDGISTSVSYRNGHVKIGYNITEDKYFIEEQRP